MARGHIARLSPVTAENAFIHCLQWADDDDDDDETADWVSRRVFDW